MPLIILIIIFLLLNTSQPILLALGLLTITLIYKLFWRPFQPKSIFFGLLLFWLSIIIKLFYADISNVSFDELSISPNILQTAYLAMISLLVFSIAIYIMTSKVMRVSINSLQVVDNSDYNPQRAITLYIASIFFKILVTGLGLLGSTEIAKALLTLRVGIIFVLIYILYKKTNSFTIPILLISIEVVLSFSTYFANFKDILISFIVAITYFKINLNGKQIVVLTILAAGCLYLLLIWQAVKGDYRKYLSGGERSQRVVVDQSDALNQFYTLAITANIDDPELWYESIDRLSYIEFFSEVTDNVPSEIPHEGGAIWKENIIHVLIPRFLDPNKKSIFDSEMVNKYATRKVEGAEVGVSFSLGFLAESYIDFGYIYMYIPVFFLGILFGLIYRFIIKTSVNHMWGCAFVSPLWVNINCNGTSGSKILGWIIVYVLVYFIVNKYFIKYLDDFLRVSGRSTANNKVFNLRNPIYEK